MKRLKKLCVAMVVVACGAPALAVWASAPPGRYTKGNGTVTDTKTKLTWQQAVGPSMMTWAAAKTYCAGLGATLGGTGWRLPTVKELATLVDTSVSSGPAIDLTFFPDAPTVGYWSGTLVANSPSFAWVVSATDGSEGEAPISGAWSTRCVR